MINLPQLEQTNPGELRFRKLIEHSFAGVTLLDRDLNVVYRSPSSERITGWNQVNSTERKAADLVHPDDAELFQQALRQVYAQPGGPVAALFRTLHYAGHYITIDCTLTNLLDEPGVEAIVFNFVEVKSAAVNDFDSSTHGSNAGTNGFSTSTKDISSQKTADEQLRLLFDRAPDMIGIMGTDRYFKRVNPAMFSQLEYTEKQLLNMSLDLLVHPDDLEISRARTEAFIAGGDQTLYFENRFLTKSGKVIWLSWTVTRFSNEGLMFCVGKNISDKKEIENLFQKASQLARIGSWEVDRVNGTAYWSPVTREIYEVPETFVPSADNWLSFYRQGADRDYIAGKMADTIATGAPCDAEVELVTAKGNTCWVRAMAEAEFRDGECVRIYGSFQDIDHRKKAELAATMALAERNVILESIGDGFFAVDRNWIITYWNATAEIKMGMGRETMLGKYFWDIYYDAMDLDFYRHYQHVMSTGKAVHFEDFYPKMQTWFGVSAYPSENGLSVFFKDITETKRTMQALAESEKRYSDLFQLSPQPMFVYDMQTLKYLDVNTAAIAHYGYSHEEFMAMTILDIRPVEDIPLVQRAVQENRERDKVILHGVFRHRKKNGALINVDIQSNVITYKGVKAKVVLANDVTERVRYIQAIEAQNEKLREISWMQSHVIRAPLSRIMALLPMLTLPAELDAEQQLVYDYLIASANELDQVIHSITDATSQVNLE
ncbi:PAS domain S-box protein [Dyadobacter sp. CY323]|uniref:PAS domain-containing protein n=1 Tax=Dyadobacter sp. CY323 TaxID=2907302 RepID=UPI001F2934DF|nr:PAS domain S-box protein [Dyadobacter sp. CY323]MCE6991284.1 PAS domain S-box protein [Dyadobacter sp. CY323]